MGAGRDGLPRDDQGIDFARILLAKCERVQSALDDTCAAVEVYLQEHLRSLRDEPGTVHPIRPPGEEPPRD